MRELTYVATRQLEWREQPNPALQSRFDALVKPVAATTCDVDKMIILGHSPVQPPFAIGHECVAEVVDLGDGVTHLVPGDPVVVPWHICCGRCDRCNAGLYAHCRTVPYMAMFGTPIGGTWGGLFSDLVRVPYADTMLVPLPASLDPVAMAAASDNYSLAWRLVAPHLASHPGARVLIMNRGSVGLYACDIAGALGASRRLYVDPDADRRAIAQSFGAEVAETIDPIHHGFEIAVESTGRVDALATALRSLVPEGICESAGGHFRPGELPLFEIYLNSVTLRIGRDNTRAHIPDALDLA
jgi:threonine dehydrogenase-like Zn-dependent dehydrogenase